MKKLLLAGAALALIASPVAAQDWQGQTYGQDGAAWWALEADVDVFCRINAAGGQVTGVTGAPASFNDAGNANGEGGSRAEADGTLTLDIQDADDNTVQESGAGVTYAKSQCNTPFSINVNSRNGGLENTDNTTDNGEFLSLVPYVAEVKLAGFGSGILPVTGGDNDFGDSDQAEAGDFYIGIRVDSRDDLLLEGTYSDFLKVTMAPTMSGPST